MANINVDKRKKEMGKNVVHSGDLKLYLSATNEKIKQMSLVFSREYALV